MYFLCFLGLGNGTFGKGIRYFIKQRENVYGIFVARLEQLARKIRKFYK